MWTTTVPMDAYHVGTLAYTKMSLAMLFFWLLWGDFCYQLMESVTPSIMPLRMQDLGATNKEIGLLTGSIPTFVYMVMNPIISFKSDRFRSRWGRRIPFIFVTLPFLVLSLIGLAFSGQIAAWTQAHVGAVFSNVPPKRAAMYVIAGLLVIFTFFNTFLTSVFWYLFNDVVPELLLARFMSLFRIISMLSAALYTFEIFRFAGTHSTAIFLGAAALYFVGFGLMCVFVREGKYPPPPKYTGNKSGAVAAVKTFAIECHSSPMYWNQWIICIIGSFGGAAGGLGGTGITAFAIFYYQSLGMNLEQIGDIFTVTLLGTGILIPISGWLADRYHPFRVVLAGALLGSLIATPVNFIWLFWHPSTVVAYWICLGIALLLFAPSNALSGIYDPPLLMRIFPRSRFGQFCATNAIWRNIGGVIGPFTAGSFLDYMEKTVGKKEAYFFIPVWQTVFAIPALYFLFRLFWSWKRHGGDESYVPPMVTDPEGLELPVALR